ncbi:MAG: SDR family oxidoreductase [Lentisphaeria bacterium]|jgi:NAD(P)-dependent dehydrogenase (short-subunit alcohol dehydrogenase family)
MKTALVTGASRGIGRELAKILAANQIRVFATGRDAALLNTLREETGCFAAPCDLADPEQVLALWQAAHAALGGRIDILVNNAGFNSRKAPLAETTLEEFEAQYAVNLRAPYLLAREALKAMAAAGSGHIVNILSSCVHYANETMGVYTTMKHALHGLTAVLRKEARPHNVKVTAVYPGGTDTEFRPNPRPNPRPDYLAATSAATMIAGAIFAPADVAVHDLTFRPLVESNF